MFFLIMFLRKPLFDSFQPHIETSHLICTSIPSETIRKQVFLNDWFLYEMQKWVKIIDW